MPDKNIDTKLNTSWAGSGENKKPEPIVNADKIPAPKLTLDAKEDSLIDPFEKKESSISAETNSGPPKISISDDQQAENSIEPSEEPLPAQENITPSQETTSSDEVVFPKPSPATPPPGAKPQETKKPQPIWKTILKIIGIFLGILVFVYVLLNFPTFYDKIKFLFNPPEEISIEEETTPKEPPKPEIIPIVSSEDIYLSFLDSAMDLPVNYVEPPEEAPPAQNNASGGGGNSGSGEIANNTLIIPRLGKRIPIVWNSPPDENAMLENLQRGVAHYAGTPLPGEGKGPIFITGHSSYYWWDKGKYKTVFANLDKMQVGDKIQVKYNNEYYTYEVFDKIVVLPDQVDVLTQVNEPILDLMTCVPVGTNQKRLIIKSKQI